MKFTIEIKPFQRIMANAMKVVNKKASIAILSSVKICKNKEGDCELVAATNESTLRQLFPMNLIEGDFKQFCVEASELNNVVMNAPGDMLTFILDDKPNMIVQYINGKYSVPVNTIEEFPELEGIKEKTCAFKMPAEDLIPTIKSGFCCCAEDQLRPVLNTIYFDVKPDGCVIVATDGHTMMKKQFQYGAPFVEGKPVSMMVPRDMIGVITNTFSGSGDVEISTDGGRVLEMSYNEARITMLTVEGKFPNYESVIPKKNPINFIVNRKALISAIRRVSTFSNESSRLIVLTVKDKKLKINASDIDFGRAAEEYIDLVECTTSEEIRIGMKDISIMNEINIARSEEIQFQMSRPECAILIKEVDDKSLLTLLIMPMIIE